MNRSDTVKEKIKRMQKMAAAALEILDQHPAAFEGMYGLWFNGENRLLMSYTTHAQFLAFRACFPGAWKKSLSCSEGKIDYEHTLPSGLSLCLLGGELPPTCHLVEEKEDIPAQPARTVTRMRVVCD